MSTTGYDYAILPTKSEQDSLSAAMGKGAVGTMQKDKLYIIQVLAQSLTAPDRNTHPDQPSKLSEFFRQSPLAEVSEELDFSRDRSLPRDELTL